MKICLHISPDIKVLAYSINKEVFFSLVCCRRGKYTFFSSSFFTGDRYLFCCCVVYLWTWIVCPGTSTRVRQGFNCRGVAIRFLIQFTSHYILVIKQHFKNLNCLFFKNTFIRRKSHEPHSYCKNFWLELKWSLISFVQLSSF